MPEPACSTSCGHNEGPATPRSLPERPLCQRIPLSGRSDGDRFWHTLKLPDGQFNRCQGLSQETDPKTGLLKELSRPCLGAADLCANSISLEQSAFSFSFVGFLSLFFNFDFPFLFFKQKPKRMLYAGLDRSSVNSIVDLVYLKRWMHAFVSRLLRSGMVAFGFWIEPCFQSVSSSS